MLLLMLLLLGLSASAAAAAGPPPHSTKCEAALEAVCTRPPPSEPWDKVQACLTCIEKHPAAMAKGGCNQSTAVAFCYKAPPVDPPTPPPPVLPDGPTAATVSIDLGLQTEPMNKLTMGCHSDSGFAHEPRALYSQMIMGESFEAQAIDGDPPVDPETGGTVGGTWPNQALAPGAVGTTRIVASEREAFHGLQAQQLTLTSGGYVGVANRGLGNEGMVFQAGREYEGYIWAKAIGAAPLTLEVALEDHAAATPPAVLSSQTLQVPAGAGHGPAAWTQLHFKLTPKSSTNCQGIDNAEAWSRYQVRKHPPVSVLKKDDPSRQARDKRHGSSTKTHCVFCTQVSCPINKTYSGGTAAGGVLSEDSAHVCVRCAGQFRISLNSVGTALVDYAFLQPGAWARLNSSEGVALPVLRAGPEAMARMGVTLYRLGAGNAFSPHWCTKKPNIYQDRLGTNMGKVRKRRAFSAGGSYTKEVAVGNTAFF